MKKRYYIGGIAFFFFFNFPSSPSFSAPEFRRFCEACYSLRRAHPSLTVSALRCILTVAQAERALGYDEVADRLGQDYELTAHQIAALSDGRGAQKGLGLLHRAQGRHQRARLVSATLAGQTYAHSLVAVADQTLSAGDNAALIADRVLPAIDAVLSRNPKITLGTLCVFLYVVTHQEAFAYQGLAVRIITNDLGISNLPKHMRALEMGAGDWASSQLISFKPHDYDNRIRLPCLTTAGLSLACDLIACLTAQPISPPRMPRAEALDRLDSPDCMDQLGDEDFDEIIWDI